MKGAPSFGRGVLVAAGITVVGTVAASFGASHLGIACIALAYLCHILYHSPRKTGRVVLMATWLVGSIALSLLDASMMATLCFHISSLWLARSWCHLDTVLQALADLGLWLTSLVLASVAVMHSASYPLGIWTFFLVQALWPWVARTTAAWTGATPSANALPPSNHSTSQQHNAFNDAKRNAETALRRLQSQSSSTS